MASAAAVDTRLSKKVYDSPEELRLVHRAKRGDNDAFNALYNAHHSRVFVTIKRMLSDEDVSLWLANAALTKVWKGLPKFKENSKFSTWITRIAIREALMHIRSEKKHHREVSLDGMLADTSVTNHSYRGSRTSTQSDPALPSSKWLATRDLNLAGVADRLVLEQAIDRVPEQFREILRLRFWEGMSMEEIQRKISVGEPEPVSIPAVKSRILRGRTILMEQVKKIS